jgi:3-isopropylmalate/(R)-2-methylmalate dehydratase large subunit
MSPPRAGQRGVAGIAGTDSRIQVETLELDVAEFGIPYIPLASDRQGVVHVIGPELRLTVPGALVAIHEEPPVPS